MRLSFYNAAWLRNLDVFSGVTQPGHYHLANMRFLWPFRSRKKANSDARIALETVVRKTFGTGSEAVVLEELRKILADADRIVVKDSPRTGARTIFESTDKKDLDELWESLVLEKPTGWSHCMCDGKPALYVYKGRAKLVQVTNHHGASLRCSLWSSDVGICDMEKWLTWFDKRGMTGPRLEVEALRSQQEQSKKDWARWLRAMPGAIRPMWSDALGQFGEVDIPPLRAALETDIPDDGERILALLEWYGSGAGPWSGFPSYEQAAEDLLLCFTTKSVIAAIESTNLSPAQREGAARLFAGWSFGKQRPDDLSSLPDALKKILWHHTRDTQDMDKLARANRAFAK